MSEFKKFIVTGTMLDEYAWRIKAGDFFRCNEIAFNLEAMAKKLEDQSALISDAIDQIENGFDLNVNREWLERARATRDENEP